METMTAIRVKGLAKKYTIGQSRGNENFREMIARRIRNLSPFYRNHVSEMSSKEIWALKDVSFEVKQGEIVGIIGRNGAGKSTLLKILSRVTEPTRGSVEVRGRVASLLEVGTGFHSELTGRENIYLNGTILGMRIREIRKKFDEIVAFAETEKFIDTPVKHYSSGMYVRLAFAVAAHLETDILLVDEVLAVGDMTFQKKCIGKLENVSRQGRTVLVVSHNMLTVQQLCSRAILLTNAEVELDGEPSKAISRYLSFQDKKTGEVSWGDIKSAPGNDRIRLSAMRIVSEGNVTGEVDITKDFFIEIDYWNFQAGARRMVSVHLYNSKGVCVLTTGNSPSVSEKLDPWYLRPYPVGLFRTSCRIPGCLLNDGFYSVTLYVNSEFISDGVFHFSEPITFCVRDTGYMRDEYSGEWLGVVRVRLDWHTEMLKENAPAGFLAG